MKVKHILLVVGLLIGLHVSAQRLRTTFNDDFSKWTWDGGSFQTLFSNDWDNWRYKTYVIKTNFSNDWDSWRVGNDVSVKTVFFNDFDGWEVRGHGKVIRVSATFLNDLERWTISGDSDGTMNTIFSKNFGTWNIDLEDELEDDLRIGVAFIAVFTSFRQN